MRKETKGKSNAMEKYFDYIIGVMRENEEFLRKNAKGTCDEVVELINDAIDYVMLGIKRKESRKDYVNRSMAFFLNHVLMPFSYAIYADALIGNIPSSFIELRLMLESLVKCYLADIKYPDQTFFQERLELLEKLLDEERLSTSKLMKELERELESENNFVALWGKLSRDWIHTKGIMNRVVSQVVEKSDVPPWALPLPMNYTENELDTIDELRKRISQFRNLLTVTMEKYQQELGFYDLGPPSSDSV
ncbi:MAG: hypothetical protein KAX28_11505 [Candidatus Marinimicrobia bacterium]|nr:hypothetical protein [Candidatus Neomarinimicrobiota bacterium]